MPFVAFHASHELYQPEHLVRLAELAERIGYAAVSSSDHFRPWLPDRPCGHSPIWMAAAMARTTVPFTTVHAPGQRYHPAVSAQMFATLDRIFPGRFSICCGSGENLNESVTGATWPSKRERNERLLQSVDAMRRLWRSELVDVDTKLVSVRQARVFSPPLGRIKVFGAAISEETARWAGGWADGLITVGRGRDCIRGKIAAFREGGGENRPVLVQALVSMEGSDVASAESALANWRVVGLMPEQLADVADPAEFESLTADKTSEDVLKSFCVSASEKRQREWLVEYFDAGVDGVFVHYIGNDIENALARYWEEVVGRLPSRYASNRGSAEKLLGDTGRTD